MRAYSAPRGSWSPTLESKNDSRMGHPAIQAAGCRSVGVSASGVTCFDSESSVCNLAGSAENGTNRAKSSSINSRTSPSEFVNGFGFAIFARLPIICFAETDHANSAKLRQKTENMQPSVQITSGNQAFLAMAHFVVISSRSEIEVRGLLKAKVALPKIALALPWVERDLHIMIVARNLNFGIENWRSCANSQVPKAGPKATQFESISNRESWDGL